MFLTSLNTFFYKYLHPIVISTLPSTKRPHTTNKALFYRPLPIFIKFLKTNGKFLEQCLNWIMDILHIFNSPNKVKVKVSRDRLRWPKGFRYVKAPDFLDFQHYEGCKVVTLTHRPPLPQKFSWYSFLDTESTPGYMVPSVVTEKITSDITGNRS